MKSLRRLLPLLLAALLSPAGAWASGDIVIRSVVEEEIVIINAQGEQEIRHLPATEVVPGDTVSYTLHVTNSGNEAAEAVLITNPVPQHMTYKEGSATGMDTQITFSVDGGETYGLPEKLRVKNKDGSTRPAHGGDYNHLRWRFNRPLQAGETATVHFRAVLQ